MCMAAPDSGVATESMKGSYPKQLVDFTELEIGRLRQWFAETDHPVRWVYDLQT